ncbi:hypothetical protein [Canibacter oris]|uniref:Uncharacterized protein n=1 Tax=Canibacter oris TaxID=1365628 RepID=A0A840DPZ1_9MICO|nr:hypothetical protein [Canibacter oris]MBB4072068.1 hypothetical protein [Canibacter oris]
MIFEEFAKLTFSAFLGGGIALFGSFLWHKFTERQKLADWTVTAVFDDNHAAYGYSFVIKNVGEAAAKNVTVESVHGERLHVHKSTPTGFVRPGDILFASTEVPVSSVFVIRWERDRGPRQSRVQNAIRCAELNVTNIRIVPGSTLRSS